MSRRGFTILELMIVITVGAVLVTMTMVGFGSVKSRFSVRQARNGFAALHARTRAQAIEFGTTLELHVDAAGDSVWITRNDTTIEKVRFAVEFGVDVRAAGSGYYKLCMSPRGFGDASCTSFGSATTVAFAQGTDTMTAQMLPLGQLKLPGNR